MAKDLIPLTGNHSLTLPALFAPDPSAARRLIEFFTTNIRIPIPAKPYRADSPLASLVKRRQERAIPVMELGRHKLIRLLSARISW